MLKYTLENDLKKKHFNRGLHSLAKIATLEELSVTSVDPTVVNCLDNQRRTPLHVAIEWNNVSAVKFLLDHGAQPNIPNSEGLDAVHLASRFKRASILSMLSRIVFFFVKLCLSFSNLDG